MSRPGIKPVTSRSLERTLYQLSYPLQKQNNTLTKAVDEKDKTVNKKEEIIKAKDELLGQRAETINNLEQNVEMLTSKLDDLEQYGRRCSVRMFSVPQLPGQSCTDTALKVINELMEIPIGEDDVERCHNLGRPNAKGNRPIIIKFKSYKFRAAVFHAKTKRRKTLIKYS